MRDGVDAILRARMRSSRLPGKVLMQAAGKPFLSHMIERLGRSRLLRRLVVATSEDASDDPIQDLCAREGVPCFMGSAEDVLDRYYRCAQEYRMGHIAVLYADNPLIDPAVCDEVIGAYLKQSGEYDYVSNNHPPTYPDGNEVEVCSFSALVAAWREAREPFQREHVTPFIWDQPGRFRCLNVTMEPSHPGERWTLDYPEDYEFLRTVFENLYPVNPNFSMWDVIRFLDTHPEVRKINAAHADYTWYTTHAGELKTIHRKEM
jgi:spore coat polysaccharide biosynthesis protein SpsF